MVAILLASLLAVKIWTNKLIPRANINQKKNETKQKQNKNKKTKNKQTNKQTNTPTNKHTHTPPPTQNSQFVYMYKDKWYVFTENTLFSIKTATHILLVIPCLFMQYEKILRGETVYVNFSVTVSCSLNISVVYFCN